MLCSKFDVSVFVVGPRVQNNSLICNW